jgi:hypothetical protein
MADDPKPISNPQQAQQAAPAAQVNLGPNAPAQAPGSNDQSRVRVKPLKNFRWNDGSHKSPDGEAFEVARHEAADLHRNGLVDYDNEADEKRAHEDTAKSIAEGLRGRRAAASAGVSDADKSKTPLKQSTVRLEQDR